MHIEEFDRIRLLVSKGTGYKLHATSYRLQAIGYMLQATSYTLQAAGYKLQATSYKLQEFASDTMLVSGQNEAKQHPVIAGHL